MKQTAVEWLCNQIYTIQKELEAGNTVLKSKILKTNKMELVKRLGIGCVGFLIMYLMCSFYNITFDISKWSAESRFVAVMVGGFSFTMLATYPNYNFKKK